MAILETGMFCSSVIFYYKQLSLDSLVRFDILVFLDNLVSIDCFVGLISLVSLLDFGMILILNHSEWSEFWNDPDTEFTNSLAVWHFSVVFFWGRREKNLSLPQFCGLVNVAHKLCQKRCYFNFYFSTFFTAVKKVDLIYCILL